ncbi:hypothetical protein [Nocardioides dongkuii]|uniref:hypothetical protein n=1 Tax=Nocardioides dongkuii TaxID=2760089 RepID=UPI0015F9F18C|nr:hypothetical protein [Nocardioides dongkuii]
MTGALLDRELKVTWLTKALSLAVDQVPVADARRTLREDLVGEGLGREAAIKTVTALSRVWLLPMQRRDDWTTWVLTAGPDVLDLRPFHIGALLATEPFFCSLLEAVGRESRAAENVNTVAVRKRLRDRYGPRRGIDVATQRGVKTLRDLGLLVGAPADSISLVGRVDVHDSELAAWLVRCLLEGRGAESIPETDLPHAPEFFGLSLPRRLPRSAAGITQHAEGLGRRVLALSPSSSSVRELEAGVS